MPAPMVHPQRSLEVNVLTPGSAPPKLSLKVLCPNAGPAFT